MGFVRGRRGRIIFLLFDNLIWNCLVNTSFRWLLTQCRQILLLLNRLFLRFKLLFLSSFIGNKCMMVLPLQLLEQVRVLLISQVNR